MAECCLYHICRSGDESNLDVGYIGISNNPERRLTEHYKSPSHVGKALKKYDDVNMRVIESGTRDDMLLKEAELRPKPHIGWNVAIGGMGGVPLNVDKDRLSHLLTCNIPMSSIISDIGMSESAIYSYMKVHGLVRTGRAPMRGSRDLQGRRARRLELFMKKGISAFT